LGDLPPNTESIVPLCSVFTGGQAVATKLEVVVDPAVGGRCQVDEEGRVVGMGAGRGITRPMRRRPAGAMSGGHRRVRLDSRWLGGGEAMAAELEMVVDAAMGGEEALGMAR